MRADAGRKLDYQTLEVVRLRAVEQAEAGVPAAEVGRGLAALGLHPRTICTWLATVRAEGREALRARPGPGRRCKLADEQLSELADVIATTDPRDHGFAVTLWTREIVRQLIEAYFGVQLTVASVGRTLHGPGFSAQRPFYRAEQADPAAVARWKEVEYPHRRRGPGRRRNGVLRRRGRRALGLPRRHHLGPGGPDADRDGHRCPLRPEHDLGDQREGRAVVLRVRRHADRRRVHRLSPPTAARRLAHRCRAGVRRRRRPPGAPGQGPSPRPAGRCGSIGCRPTLRSSTPTNRCGRTPSTTAWPAPHPTVPAI